MKNGPAQKRNNEKKRSQAQPPVLQFFTINPNANFVSPVEVVNLIERCLTVMDSQSEEKEKNLLSEIREKIKDPQFAEVFNRSLANELDIFCKQQDMKIFETTLPESKIILLGEKLRTRFFILDGVLGLIDNSQQWQVRLHQSHALIEDIYNFVSLLIKEAKAKSFDVELYDKLIMQISFWTVMCQQHSVQAAKKKISFPLQKSPHLGYIPSLARIYKIFVHIYEIQIELNKKEVDMHKVEGDYMQALEAYHMYFFHKLLWIELDGSNEASFEKEASSLPKIEWAFIESADIDAHPNWLFPDQIDALHKIYMERIREDFTTSNHQLQPKYKEPYFKRKIEELYKLLLHTKPADQKIESAFMSTCECLTDVMTFPEHYTMHDLIKLTTILSCWKRYCAPGYDKQNDEFALKLTNWMSKLQILRAQKQSEQKENGAQKGQMNSLPDWLYIYEKIEKVQDIDFVFETAKVPSAATRSNVHSKFLKEFSFKEEAIKLLCKSFQKYSDIEYGEIQNTKEAKDRLRRLELLIDFTAFINNCVLSKAEGFENIRLTYYIWLAKLISELLQHNVTVEASPPNRNAQNRVLSPDIYIENLDNTLDSFFNFFLDAFFKKISGVPLPNQPYTMCFQLTIECYLLFYEIAEKRNLKNNFMEKIEKAFDAFLRARKHLIPLDKITFSQFEQAYLHSLQLYYATCERTRCEPNFYILPITGGLHQDERILESLMDCIRKFDGKVDVFERLEEQARTLTDQEVEIANLKNKYQAQRTRIGNLTRKHKATLDRQRNENQTLFRRIQGLQKSHEDALSEIKASIKTKEDLLEVERNRNQKLDAQVKVLRRQKDEVVTHIQDLRKEKEKLLREVKRKEDLLAEERKRNQGLDARVKLLRRKKEDVDKQFEVLRNEKTQMQEKHRVTVQDKVSKLSIAKEQIQVLEAQMAELRLNNHDLSQKMIQQTIEQDQLESNQRKSEEDYQYFLEHQSTVRKISQKLKKKKSGIIDKLRLDEQKYLNSGLLIQYSTLTKCILNALNDGDERAYIVGGYVTNILSRLVPRDIDIITTCTIEEVQKRLPDFKQSHFIPEAFKWKEYDILCMPNLDLCEDAQMRDFTINALYSTQEGQILDPTYRGVKDFLNSHLRTIQPFIQSMLKDPIRIVRLLRQWFKTSYQMPCEVEQLRALLSELKCVPFGIYQHNINLLLKDHSWYRLQVLAQMELLDGLFFTHGLNRYFQDKKNIELLSNSFYPKSAYDWIAWMLAIAYDAKLKQFNIKEDTDHIMAFRVVEDFLAHWNRDNAFIKPYTRAWTHERLAKALIQTYPVFVSSLYVKNPAPVIFTPRIAPYIDHSAFEATSPTQPVYDQRIRRSPQS